MAVLYKVKPAVTKMFDRKFHDTFALVVHSLSLVWMATLVDNVGGDKAGAFFALAFMQSVTIFFHAIYVGRYSSYGLDSPNYLKWGEYGISATAGAAAVLLSAGLAGDQFWAPASELWHWLVPLVILSTVQQTWGYLIDRNIETKTQQLQTQLLIVAASVFQLAEFVIVQVAGKPPLPLMVVYTVGWSFFGFHCALHAAYRFSGSDGLAGKRYNNRAWVEAIYSCLGWSAKLGVVITELQYLTGGKDGELLAGVGVGTIVASVAATAVFAPAI